MYPLTLLVCFETIETINFMSVAGIPEKLERRIARRTTASFLYRHKNWARDKYEMLIDILVARLQEFGHR